jgi:hypothetical protein
VPFTDSQNILYFLLFMLTLKQNLSSVRSVGFWDVNLFLFEMMCFVNIVICGGMNGRMKAGKDMG